MATITSVITSTASFSQRERLWQIDFLARFRGQLTRQDLADRFEIALSNATRDFSLYRELAPDNLEYDSRNKVYRRAASFVPLFSYDREHTLQALTQGQAKGFASFEKTVIVEAAQCLNEPNLDILATISRALYSGSALKVSYVSANTGNTTREIVPHALVNTGLRWYARAYCRKHGDFRDFVLTRFLSVELSPTSIVAHETRQLDDDWHRQVTLELVPHPKALFKRSIELDYSLEPRRILSLSVRAATAGYLLCRWSVDSSSKGVLPPDIYQLFLKNRSELSQIASLSIAPGFSLEPQQ